MYIAADTLDDLMRKVFVQIRKNGKRLHPTRGAIIELFGILLCLRNPRARISRTESRGRVFSCLGELLWYLSGTNDLAFIEYYLKQYRKESEDGLSVYGGYGPRLFRMHGSINQVDNIIARLRENSGSRRAVIQIFDAADLDEPAGRKEVPCTCFLQFAIRDNALHALASLRSNDALFGLTHDVFAFTMLQEILARALGVGLGDYRHCVGSLHLYSDKLPVVEEYLDEGWQRALIMAPMPEGDPFPGIRKVLNAESSIREGKVSSVDVSACDPYWSDLIRLLQIYAALNWRNPNRRNMPPVNELKAAMHSDIFGTFIAERQAAFRRREQSSEQQLGLLASKSNSAVSD